MKIRSTRKDAKIFEHQGNKILLLVSILKAPKARSTRTIKRVAMKQKFHTDTSIHGALSAIKHD